MKKLTNYIKDLTQFLNFHYQGIASVLQLFINLEYKVNNFYGRSKLLKLVDVYAHFSYLICLVLSFHYLLVLPFFKNGEIFFELFTI